MAYVLSDGTWNHFRIKGSTGTSKTEKCFVVESVWVAVPQGIITWLLFSARVRPLLSRNI